MLLSIALLVACSSKFSSSSNGLVVISTKGSAVMDSFSLDLGNGHMSQIFNSNGPPTNGVPSSVILAPGGATAFVMVSPGAGGTATGVESFPVATDGKLGSGATSTLNPSTQAIALCTFTNSGGQTVVQDIPVTVNAPVIPTAMTIDAAGKLLFVSDSSTAASATYECNGSSVTSSVSVPGAVSVFTVSSGSLTEVSGSPFELPIPEGGQAPSASSLAVTPTIYPPAFALCSGSTPPSTENLFVTDSLNYVVLNYSVASSGVLTLVPPTPSTIGVGTGTVPSGVAVDPCNRFVYVSNGEPNNSVSAFAMCSVVNLPTCNVADFSLRTVVGSPFIAGPGTGPLLVDPLGSYLYVLDEGEDAIRPYSISLATGALTPLNPSTVATAASPTSMAIRSDDTWMFVANSNSGNLSQYAITPKTGVLIPQQPVETDPTPWGVAVR
jgi:Lactonase, 7-bladed beta-propeller